jgi:hypothetical protein
MLEPVWVEFEAAIGGPRPRSVRTIRWELPAPTLLDNPAHRDRIIDRPLQHRRHQHPSDT